MGTPLFSCKVSRGIDSVLNSGVTGLCFDSKLRKCSSKCIEDLFWPPQRKIGDLCKHLCHSVTGKSARRSHRTRTAKWVRDNRLFVNYSAKSLEPPLVLYDNSTKAFTMHLYPTGMSQGDGVGTRSSTCTTPISRTWTAVWRLLPQSLLGTHWCYSCRPANLAK